MLKPVYCCIILTLLSLGLASCSSTFTAKPNSNIKQTQLISAPFYPQEKYQCGPAALATVLNFQDAGVSVDALVEQIYIPNKKGSLQLEIKAAIRRANLLPYELPKNLNALIQQVNNGTPVLVLQNLGLGFWPQWHYAVVVGFNVPEQTLILHSGTHENYRVSLRTFMNTWKRADFWAVAALKPTSANKHLNEKAFITAAISLETIGKQNLADNAYQSALKIWPNNSIALIGTGNAHFRKQQFTKAGQYYFKAVEQQPKDAASWNNLAFALAKQHCPNLAQKAINQALYISEQQAKYLQSKEEIKTFANGKNAKHCQTLAMPNTASSGQ